MDLSHNLSLQTLSRAGKYRYNVQGRKTRAEGRYQLIEAMKELCFQLRLGKKLKQKEVGCSIWQSMQSRRLPQQWWNHKSYKNSSSRMRFSRMFIYLQKSPFAFICSFLFYLHQWHKFLQLVDLNPISY